MSLVWHFLEYAECIWMWYPEGFIWLVFVSHPKRCPIFQKCLEGEICIINVCWTGMAIWCWEDKSSAIAVQMRPLMQGQLNMDRFPGSLWNLFPGTKVQRQGLCVSWSLFCSSCHSSHRAAKSLGPGRNDQKYHIRHVGVYLKPTFCY